MVKYNMQVLLGPWHLDTIYSTKIKKIIGYLYFIGEMVIWNQQICMYINLLNNNYELCIACINLIRQIRHIVIYWWTHTHTYTTCVNTTSQTLFITISFCLERAQFVILWLESQSVCLDHPSRPMKAACLGVVFLALRYHSQHNED